MKSYLLLLSALFFLVGCDTKEKNPFFAPEISGATYAATVSRGDPTSDDVSSPSSSENTQPNKVVKLALPNTCYFTQYGWTCTGDIFNENGPMTVSDQAGGYYCAPRFVPLSTP